MWRTILWVGAALALGALALQWIEYRIFARANAAELYVALIAAAFLGLGVWLGARFGAPRPNPEVFSPNTRAAAALGITEREYEVLRLLAAGRSNKQIAQGLSVSPNTVKTHVARLFGKLEAARRTEAIARARELGLIP